jgi:hypothetical protein
MMPVHTNEQSKGLPWIVLAGAGWLVAICASLRFLPTYLLRDAVLVAAPGLAAIVIACLPRSILRSELARFVKSWFVCMSLYSLIVAASTLVLLLGCSAVGYLPYSDRPGPSWGNVPVHLPGLHEIAYFAGWAVFLLPMYALWGSVFFFFAAWSGWFGTPRWLMRVLGGVFCGYLTLCATDAAGWYIAIAAFPVCGAGLAGVLFGALVLPRFSGPAGSRTVKWKRVVFVSCAAFAVAALVTYPLWSARL